jgi:hypothetical protein
VIPLHTLCHAAIQGNSEEAFTYLQTKKLEGGGGGEAQDVADPKKATLFENR